MADQIKLYTGAGAAGLATHWCLRELGLPFELVLLDLDAGEQHLPDYRKINPTGRVPALSINGTIHTESTALLMLLAENYPKAGLEPPSGSSERAAYLQWMIWLANALLPAYRAWFYADGAGEDDTKRVLRQAAKTQIEACLDQLNDHFSDERPCILGSSFSVADMQLTMLLRWSRNMPKPSQDWSHLRRYQNEMKARPLLQEVHRVEGLTDWISDL